MINRSHLTAAGLLLLLTGCLRAPAPLVFHALQPVAPAALSRGAEGGLAVEVEPVRLPEMLQHSHLVLVLGPGRMTLAPGDRWGNGLDLDMQQVLTANLGRLLGSDRVVSAPQGGRVKARYRVEVAVRHCEGRPEGTLQFEATWMVSGRGSGTALRMGTCALELPVPGKDAHALVDAHDRALAALSQGIAEALRTLSEEPGRDQRVR